MALSVLVRTYSGEVLSELLSPAIASLCDPAGARNLPYPGVVDVYDDTVFNRLQAPRIVVELESLRGVGNSGRYRMRW